MKKKNIHNLLIIDASGSMRDKVDEVRGGVNQIFKDLKEDQQAEPNVDNKITVVDFSSHGDFKILFNSVKTSELTPLEEKDYIPRAMTALYDAIGKAFQLVPEETDGVFVTIFTDGLENDSKEFNSNVIKELITEKEAKGWTVTFMGTTQEAMIQAQSLGITKDNMLAYKDSKLGTMAAFDRIKSARKKFSNSVVMEAAVDNIFDKDDVNDTSVE